MNARTQFIAEIEAFLAETGLSPTAFGRLAINDRALMHTLWKQKRNPRLATVDRVRAFMSKVRREQERKRVSALKPAKRVASRAPALV